MRLPATRQKYKISRQWGEGDKMKLLHWLVEEIKTVIAVTIYFAICFVLIMILKQLLLTQYGIAFHGITTAFIIALVTAKVVVVLRKVPLSRIYDGQPGIVDVVARTLLYTVATLFALLLEHAFETRSEYGGFLKAVPQVFEHRDVSRVWATTICVALAFAAYNTFGVIFETLGPKEVRRIFFAKNRQPT